MIVGWICTSIDPRIRSTVSFISEASTLSESLRVRFSVGNEVRKQVLKDEIAFCKQDSQPVLEYYGRLSKLWEELQNYKSSRVYRCEAAPDVEKEREDDQIHQFLFGPDLPRFSHIRSKITDEDPLPSLNLVYSREIREDQNLDVDGQRDNKTRSDCFPDWYYEKKSLPRSTPDTHDSLFGFDNKAVQRGGRSNRGTDRGRGHVHSAQAASSLATSTDQIPQQISVLQAQRPNVSYEQLSEDCSILHDVIDIIPSAVTKPDGTASRATKRGVLPLNSTYKLRDVLYAPDFDCTLISISKLLKQTSSIAVFTDTLCFLQYRFSRTLIGAGEEREGVYYFTGVLAARVHIALIHVIRSDNGTEFMCLTPYFQEHGILHQTSCVDTPQQNGRAERKHRHILNVARACLFQGNLPVKFWGENILIATHLINRTPSSVLNDKTPYEVLFGTRPSYDMLCTLRCLCYAHIRHRDRDNFKSRSRKCVLLGYPYGKKAWRVYDLDSVSSSSPPIALDSPQSPIAIVSPAPTGLDMASATSGTASGDSRHRSLKDGDDPSPSAYIGQVEHGRSVGGSCH
ncbi:PREDICTED: uncharacterized protein LOC104710243 [Camelina sativa]|uniref:Uncharacterized protein LOC104710243 n=1 Tax=Camelina sativa TaxID=90675 RepID=A0ABM0TEC9_CAMSA|nr:PREDICTED: uncharacterized protein LOC104710243 [Camelina sativa]